MLSLSVGLRCQRLCPPSIHRIFIPSFPLGSWSRLVWWYWIEVFYIIVTTPIRSLSSFDLYFFWTVDLSCVDMVLLLPLILSSHLHHERLNLIRERNSHFNTHCLRYRRYALKQKCSNRPRALVLFEPLSYMAHTSAVFWRRPTSLCWTVLQHRLDEYRYGQVTRYTIINYSYRHNINSINVSSSSSSYSDFHVRSMYVDSPLSLISPFTLPNHLLL